MTSPSWKRSPRSNPIFDPKQHCTGFPYIGLFQLSKYEFDRYGSGEITDARNNVPLQGRINSSLRAILFELETHREGDAG